MRATAGDLLRITLDNQLPTDSSIHWHGIALRNAADGVPGLTQDRSQPAVPSSTSSPPPTRARTSTTPTSGYSSIEASTRH